MDVLREVRKAEEKARETEADYRKQAEEILASVGETVQEEKRKTMEEVKKEIEAYEEDLDRSLNAEQQQIAQKGESEREALEGAATGKKEEAVAYLLGRLGL